MLRKDDIFPIGQIAKPHGVKGEMAFTSASPVLAEVAAPFVVLEPDGLLVPFFVENIRMKSNTAGLLKLERIDTEAQARELAGLRIFLPNTYLQSVKTHEVEAEYFAGFAIVDETGAPIGTVRHVDESTANALFVVETETGEALIPIADELLVEIDHEKKIIRVNLPDGLLAL